MSVRDWQDAEGARTTPPTGRARRGPILHRVWNGMLAAMKAKLEAGELTAFGQEDPPFGPWHAIPAPAWRQLRITNVRKGEASVGANIVHDIHILPPDADGPLPHRHAGTGRPRAVGHHLGIRVSAPRRGGRDRRQSRRRSRARCRRGIARPIRGGTVPPPRPSRTTFARLWRAVRTKDCVIP